MLSAKYWFDKLLESKVEKLAHKGVKEAVVFVKGQAQLLAPVETGMLRDSIKEEVKDNEGIVYTNVEYADDVEFGTKKSRAQPYMSPAIYDNKDTINHIVNNNVKGGLK